MSAINTGKSWSRILGYGVLICWCWTVGGAVARGQYAEIGIGAGLGYYRGDITHPKTVLSGAHPFLGVRAAWQLGPHVWLAAGYHRGTLSGQDSRSPDESQRRRNLSFQTTVREWSLGTEVSLMPYRPHRVRRAASPYLHLGGAWFDFQPKALYRNQWVALQPLGTEGQGLPQYPERQPYRLQQAAVITGLGIRFAVSPRVNFALAYLHRWTFTDYLDDVSTTYVRPDWLIANGPLAVALSNRTPEYTGEPADDMAGMRRGNSNNNDTYGTLSLQLTFNLFRRSALQLPLLEEVPADSAVQSTATILAPTAPVSEQQPDVSYSTTTPAVQPKRVHTHQSSRPSSNREHRRRKSAPVLPPVYRWF